jgi:hypothetical protein
MLVLTFYCPSILQLRRPQVSIDGLFAESLNWGKQFIPLSTGTHQVSVHVSLIGALGTNPASCQFEVIEGQIRKLRWRAPLVLSGRGTWEDLGPIES